MLSISSLIEFLLDLLRDDDALEEFDRDPQAMLAAHGLGGITGQDVRDVRPLLVDQGYLQARSDDDDDGGVRASYSGNGDAHGSSAHDDDHRSESHSERYDDHGSKSYHQDGGGDGSMSHQHDRDDDPVKEIYHVKNNYEVDKTVVVNNTYNEYNTHNEYDIHNEYNDYDVDIDDRDTIVVGDDNTVVQDSFNEDNDGVDNKGGVIDESIVAGDDVSESGNTDNSVTVEDSFNPDNSVDISDSGNDNSDRSDNSTNDSGNTDNSTVVDVDDSFQDSSDNSTNVGDSFAPSASGAAGAEVTEPADEPVPV